MKMAKQKITSKKTAKVRQGYISLEVQYVPMDSIQMVAWRAGLLLLLDILKRKGPDESHQEKTNRHDDRL